MKISEVQNKKILFSCLNWGMGHVSRSIGLIHSLIKQNNTVIIAGESDQLKIFKTYFTEIQTIELAGYPFEFEENKSFQQAIWKQKSKLRKFMNYEKKWVNEKVSEYAIDLVLSDHRYGFRSRKCISIFITHQIHLPLIGIYSFFQLFHSFWMKQFNAVWIIDDTEDKLAGKLSSSPNLKHFEYIGWFSRFQLNAESTSSQKKDISILVLSGPNVHLDYLYQNFLLHANNQNQQIVIGKPSALALLPKHDHVSYLESSNWLELDMVLTEATEIFSFFGYSTLMDAKFLSADFYLIPCPGQWEQEYLSSIHPKVVNKQ